MNSDTGSTTSFSMVLIIALFHHYCLLSSLKTKSHIEMLSWQLTIKNLKIAAIWMNQFLVAPLFQITVSKLVEGRKKSNYWHSEHEWRETSSMLLESCCVYRVISRCSCNSLCNIPSHTFHSASASKSSEVVPLTLIRHLYSKLTPLFYCHLREHPWRFWKRNWLREWPWLCTSKRQSSWNVRRLIAT